MITPEQAEGLRRWASGSYGCMAGVELIIRSPMAARIMDGYLVSHDQDPEVPTHFVWPDVARAYTAQLYALSGGEKKVLKVLRSLLDPSNAPGVDLTELAGINTDDSLLILAAIAHAMGLYERDGGTPIPWP